MKKDESQSKSSKRQLKRFLGKRMKSSPKELISSTNSLPFHNRENFFGFYKGQNIDSMEIAISTVSSNKVCYQNITSFIKEKIAFIPSYANERELDEKMNYDENLNNSTDLLNSSRVDYMCNHPILDDKKRLILLDWIMQVSSELGFKRSTYHGTVVLIDLFLSKISSIPVEELQLLGVSSLEIQIPCIENFAQTTDNSCKKDQIIAFEKRIILALNWKIQFPNLLTWGNYITHKWDNFVMLIEYNFPKFRNIPGDDYLMRNFFLLIDIISLDYCHIKLNPKLIVCSIVFLLIGLSLNCLDLKEVLANFPNEPNCENFYYFNHIFNTFLQREIGLSSDELAQSIPYICQFFNLQFDYSGPIKKGIV